MKYKNTEVFAQNLDETDKLAKHRNDFFYPKDNNKNELICLLYTSPSPRDA